MKSSSLVFAALGLTALCGRAEAAVVIDIWQSGDNVVTTDSGSVNLTDLSNPITDNVVGHVTGFLAFVVVGTGTSDEYLGVVSSPSSIGTGDTVLATKSSADPFGVVEGDLIVPSGYVSGTALPTASSIYEGYTLETLGLTPGTYLYTWGHGANADSLTVNIEAVPEASTWAMMLAGFAGLGLAGYRLRRA